jgi:hypothetical protein
MAKNQTVRIRPALLQADMDALTALQAITTYTPANAAYAKTAMDAKHRDASRADRRSQRPKRALNRPRCGHRRRMGFPQRAVGSQRSGDRAVWR